jgi:hypothetical protein
MNTLTDNTTQEGTVEVSELINLDALKELLSSIERKGEDVVVDRHAADKIRNFKRAMKLMSEAEKLLKAEIISASEAFHANTIRGHDLTISIGAGRASSKYTLQDGFKHEWGKQQVTYVPDADKIEEYILENGALPEGVTLNEVNKTVTIRVKG